MSQFAVSRFCVHVESYHGSRPERIVWTPSERAPISGGQSARSAIPTSTPTTEVTTLPSTTTTTGITTLLTIGNIAARLLFLRLTFRPLARLAQNEEPAQPERIKESSCLPWGNASGLNTRIASNRAGRRHFPA